MLIKPVSIGLLFWSVFFYHMKEISSTPLTWTAHLRTLGDADVAYPGLTYTPFESRRPDKTQARHVIYMQIFILGKDFSSCKSERDQNFHPSALCLPGIDSVLRAGLPRCENKNVKSTIKETYDLHDVRWWPNHPSFVLECDQYIRTS